GRYINLDMVCDSVGNVYWLCYLPPGQLAATGNPVITTAGVYLLQYNAQGDLDTLMPFDIQMERFTNFTRRMARDPNNGRFYVAGYFDHVYSPEPLSMGGQPITHPAYVGAFNAQGQMLWKKEDTATQSQASSFTGRPVIDKWSNI